MYLPAQGRNNAPTRRTAAFYCLGANNNVRRPSRTNSLPEMLTLPYIPHQLFRFSINVPISISHHTTVEAEGMQSQSAMPIPGQGQGQIDPPGQSHRQTPIVDAAPQTQGKKATVGVDRLSRHGAQLDVEFLRGLGKREHQRPAPEGYYGAHPSRVKMTKLAKIGEDMHIPIKILLVKDSASHPRGSYISLVRYEGSSSTCVRFQLEACAVSPKM